MPPDRREAQNDEELDEVTLFENYWREHLSRYVRLNPPTWSTNTKVFSFLALLNAYIPDSYLLKDECQQILGPPDPIHGGPPFEKRMEPFTRFINTSIQNHVSMIHPQIAKKAVELLADSGFTRSTTAKNLMVSLCGDQPKPHIVQFIKDLLIKREMGDGGKERFSKLISDVKEHEKNHHAVSVLKTASAKFTKNPNFPQIISRLFLSLCQRDSSRRQCNFSRNQHSQYLQYREEVSKFYRAAETWAREAIRRAEENSYIADTLGQICKRRLIKCPLRDVPEMGKQALQAFKHVEIKAEKEMCPQRQEPGGTVSLSHSFNNRGLFGFIQVAKIIAEKYGVNPNVKMEVETKFDFFEWYLTYSRPTMTTLEPPFFWKDVALCYEYYTGQTAAASISFPGLLEHLNRGLFTSRGRRASFQEIPTTQAELESIRDQLKSSYEEHPDDIDVAERYVFSNIILSNKMQNAPQFDLVTELQKILHRFLDKDVRSPKFYLLVLLLFWPEEHHQLQQEEEDDEECQATEDEESSTRTWEDIDGEEPAQISPPDLVLDVDLEQCVRLMEKAFERAKYGKYLRGRYLLPLFFLGKGSGLSRWIHKSRLDAIVEENVNRLAGVDTPISSKEKMKRINEMWRNGSVWHLQQIRDILLPVRVEPCQPTPPELQRQEVFVHAGEKRIKARTEVNQDQQALPTMLFYLGFTIQGPVVFKVGAPQNA